MANDIRDEFNSEVDSWPYDPTFENAQRWPHHMINSFEAIANLELVRGYEDSLRPGKGVTIGILDNGIDLDHDVFTSRPQNQERSLSNIMMEDGATQNDHGTAVAGIAGGEYGAYGANIKSYAIRLGDGSGEYEPVTLRQLNAIDYGSSELYSYILNDGVDILNLSFGFQGSIEDYSEQDLRNNHSRTIRTLAQSEKDHNKTILVWAEGMLGGNLPPPNRLLLKFFPEWLLSLMSYKATP
ncbi:MAG: S8 family serine peptidase [Cyanobacteria bacterium MAG CAR4_bin_6]|nr:S8 family serine peptidase [Cyanobacteria bacterium MAG CAR4_bin_6]